MRRYFGFTLILLAILGFGKAAAQEQSSQQKALPESTTPEYGPARGALVLVGGGDDRATGIMETFINLAGGLGAKFVLVPTANGNQNPDGSVKVYNEEAEVGPWRRLGIANIHMLHTSDKNVANTEEFVKPLRDADGVWFEGGRQWNIIDSYKGTLTEQAFREVLARGGVVGGSSAGASALGDLLIRGAVSGPDVVLAPEPDHLKGLDLLHRTAIDQHINAFNRWDDLIPVIKSHPELLGIGLSEGTAIIVRGDRFEVWGKWKVAVHDNTHLYQPWEKPYYLLEAGDVYNMKTRQIEKLGDGPQPRPQLIPAERYSSNHGGNE
jgi:cyanophycinase